METMTKKRKTDKFAGFLANPNARRRGGKATRAVRCRCRRGLLERLAQMEANRRWRAEIARRETSR